MKVHIVDDFKIKEWWSNFYNYLRMKYPRGEDRDELTINKELEPYNAKLFRQWNNSTPYVEFNTEQDYVMFVLTWS